MTIRVRGLFVHPLKSAASVEVDELSLDWLGAVGDRRWLVTDEAGEAITARERPALALVTPTFAAWEDGGATHGEGAVRRNVDSALVLRAPRLGLGAIRLHAPDAGPAVEVRVWGDALLAYDVGTEAAEWMSTALNRACRVVRLSDEARRPLRAKYAGDVPRADRVVAFTDGAPLLLLGQGSIDALNDRLIEQGGDPVDRTRFRPNVLLDGAAPLEEDQWSAVTIGALRIAVGEPCSRCVMTTIDPRTGEGGIEPLRTLAGYRRQDGFVMFGMNATNATPGVIRVGEEIAAVPR